MSTRYLTVVYAINDEEAFEPTSNGIFALYNDKKDIPFSVCAVSADHEIQRVDLIEGAMESLDDPYEFRTFVTEIINQDDVGMSIATTEALD